MDVLFLDKDIVVIMRDTFKDWQELDSKLVMVKINENIYLRKVFFENAIPFLRSFNSRLFPDIAINDLTSVKYIGQLKIQLYRNVENIKF